MGIRTEEPTTWNELTEVLWDKSFDTPANKWRAYTAFRGLPEDYSLQAPHRTPNMYTKLQRMSEEPGTVHGRPGSLEWKERRILDCFRMYERLSIRTGNTDWDVMLLGQHHGLPTRLLDWTSSPLAALFFACEDYTQHDRNGVVCCVRRLETSAALPAPVNAKLEATRTSAFPLEALKNAYPTIKDFDQLPSDSLLFFEPPSVSPRIVAQYALFSVMPGTRTHILPWLETHNSCCWKVVVRAELKKEFRERLMIMNVSERTMYPGLDGTCRWISAWYA